MNGLLEVAECLACRGPLCRPGKERLGASCSKCGFVYPVVEGRLPILVRDPRAYLSEMFLYYEARIRQQEQEAAKIARGASTSIRRLPIVMAFQEAIRKNCGLLRKLQVQLLPHVTPESCAQAVPGAPSAQDSSYLDDLMYLQRDWCWLEEGERELEQMRKVIFSALESFAPARARALVLGAGAGRLAWDLCERLQEVWAVDMSLTAANYFYEVLQGDVEFFELTAKNVRRPLDAIRRHTASRQRPGTSPTAAARDGLSYVIADARNLPLPDASVAVALSAYFTDVVPLRTLLPELRRVLQPNAIFVHYGPLEYHFTDLADALSVEEVKCGLTGNGFSIVAEGVHSGPHLRSTATMSSRVFDNVLLVARYNGAKPGVCMPDVSNQSVLKLAGRLRVDRSEVLSPDGYQDVSATLTLPSGRKFEGAASVAEILRHVDGKRAVNEIIALLGSEYDISDETPERVLEALRSLCASGALELVELPQSA